MIFQRVRSCGLAAAFACAATAALAHPHVWVDVRSELAYANPTHIEAVRHRWTFDPAYSAYITQGLDTNHDGTLESKELQELAKVNVESLAEFAYFTVLKANGVKQSFKPPIDYSLDFDKTKGQITLHFTLPLESKADAGKVLGLEIYDPTYFVSFAMAPGDDAITLNGASKGCLVTVTRPKPVPQTDSTNLSEAFFSALTASSDFGAQFANKALVACP